MHIGCLCTAFSDCFLLNKIMGMSALSLLVDTSKHFWTMVQVDMTILVLVPSCYQYHFVLDFIIQRYFNFLISVPNFMACLSTILSSCNIYGYDNNFDNIITHCVWICSIYCTLSSIMNKFRHVFTDTI